MGQQLNKNLNKIGSFEQIENLFAFVSQETTLILSVKHQTILPSLGWSLG